MSVALDLSPRLHEILTRNEVHAVVLDKLREFRVVEIADMVGIASDAQDLGEFFILLKRWRATLRRRKNFEWR